MRDEADDPLTGVVDLAGAYLANCAVRDDETLWCWGSQYSDVAAPLLLSGSPVTDVAMQTACGSGAITGSVRYLTADDELYFGTSLIAQDCG
ncbi:MAG: hypothetical protein JKY37_13850 [Nannocystaceae bacterium]|nr:hypothetical protein [Nannocystaceae bacterium]